MVLLPPLRNGPANVIKQLQIGNKPVFSFEGPQAVIESAMMTDLIDANESLIARSIALDIYGPYKEKNSNRARTG
ncbi:MAG: hypothetical protein ACI9J2_002345 [Saprospiraceae bacterium]|jgi:hypothetical protein